MADNNTFSLFSDYDVYLFRAGKHYNLYDKLGNHRVTNKKQEGVYFAVWAPNALQVSVTGDFNQWDPGKHPMRVRSDESGIWEVFIPGVKKGALYQYHIESRDHGTFRKGDPYAAKWEYPPGRCSVVWEPDFEWSDGAWMQQRQEAESGILPLSVYEMHLGSWKRVPEEGDRYLNYREMAESLPQYCRDMGFTHVEMMPVMEHPFYGSWGYQITGFYAPSRRYGNPEDLMYLINALHENGVGVILDWVPSHFPGDDHGLYRFDGTCLYEHEDPRKGFHPDWKSYIFNYGRYEVKNFLISNAMYWLQYFHADGLRVDAVASMLYLDYSREYGQWEPNIYGGRENLESVRFLQEFNDAVHQYFPGVQTIAEESTAWPGVTHPTVMEGLGFDKKWMMGWMHDTLDYLQKDPLYRSYHMGQLTFSIHYAFSEKFVLPLSHDEVVHGKGSLINKMPGDDWKQRANLRLCFGYMYAHPGGKMLFMGSELGQRQEWSHDRSLDWHLLQYPDHEGIRLLVQDLNHLYKQEPALYQGDYSPEGFEWVDAGESGNCILSWIRQGNGETVYVIANFTPDVVPNYRVGVSVRSNFREVFNTDNLKYGGSDILNDRVLKTYPVPWQGHAYSFSVWVPPLGVIFLKSV